MILVTGATGIVGSHVAVELLRSGKKVRVLQRQSSSLIALKQLLKYHNLSDTIDYFIGDINDPISLQESMIGCDTVFHCAALVSFHQADQDLLHETNVLGTENVVNACLEAGCRLSYISSTATIGDQIKNDERDEESAWVSDKGKSDYTLSKRYAEMEVFRGVQEGLNAVVVNPGVVLGPGNWGHSSTTIFLTGIKGMTFYSSGSNGFVDARDVAEKAIALLDQPNISGKHLLIGENISFRELFTKFHQLFNAKKPGIAVPRGPVMAIVKVLNAIEKIRLSPLQMTSENLKSAYRRVVYSNKKMSKMGFTFRSVEEALLYTNEVYQQSQKG